MNRIYLRYTTAQQWLWVDNYGAYVSGYFSSAREAEDWANSTVGKKHVLWHYNHNHKTVK